MRKMQKQITALKQPTWLVSAMTQYYCHLNHSKGCLCKDCEALIKFEQEKAQSCEMCQNNKGCTRQCYPAEIRLKLNHILLWTEPKMKWRKPLLIVRKKLFNS